MVANKQAGTSTYAYARVWGWGHRQPTRAAVLHWHSYKPARICTNTNTQMCLHKWHTNKHRPHSHKNTHVTVDQVAGLKYTHVTEGWAPDTHTYDSHAHDSHAHDCWKGWHKHTTWTAVNMCKYNQANNMTTYLRRGDLVICGHVLLLLFITQLWKSLE
jgi:hypothetical protein